MRKSLEQARQKEKVKPVKLKVNMSASKGRGAGKVSKPARSAPIAVIRSPSRSPLQSISPDIPSSPPAPPPPPAVRFQTTWRVQIEGEEKDIWCSSSVENSRTLNLTTAYKTVQSCKQSIPQSYVDNYQLIKLTATSTKEKGRDKPEVASMMCTSYSEFDKVYGLMETIRYWSAAANVVIKVDCVIRLRVQPEASTNSSAVSGESSVGVLGGLTMEQISTLLGGVAQQPSSQPGAGKAARKSTTQQQRLNLPGNSLVEALTGNPGPLIVSRWVCELATCPNCGNSCYSVIGSNRELSTTHYPMNGDVVRLWAQSIKTCKDGTVTAENPPPAILLRLGLLGGGRGQGGGERGSSRSRDAAQHAAQMGLGASSPYSGYPPHGYPPLYSPQPPYPHLYAGYGAVQYPLTTQPVEALPPRAPRKPTSSPIRDEEDGDSIRRFFEYLVARSDYASCTDLLLKIQSDLLQDYFDLQGLKTDVTASWWSDHSFPTGLLPRIRRALADYRKQGKTP